MKLTIRDLFWLILSAALAFGWYTDHLQLLQRADTAENQLIRYERPNNG